MDFGQNDFNEGDFAQANCVLQKGHRPVVLSWFLNGKPLLPLPDSGVQIDEIGRSSILTLESVRSHNQGTYTCTATNAAGSTEVTAKLVVHELLRLILIDFEGLKVQEDDFAHAYCVLQKGDVPVTFTLHFNDQVLSPSSDNRIAISNVDDKMSTLQIVDIRVKHAGCYSCVASNRAGSTDVRPTLVSRDLMKGWT